jgi:hypothetical protein
VKRKSYVPRRIGRLRSAWCLVLSCCLYLAVPVPAGTIEIPAWAFDRGNVVIDADPAKYADAGPVVVSGEEMPWGWRVQYDVEYPVAGKYQLHIRYAATEARPVEVLFDTRNVSKICTRIGLDPDTGEPSAKSSGATSEILLSYFGNPDNLSRNRKQKAEAGKHTIILASTTPLPNLVSLRLTTPEPFPEEWQPPEYKVKDLASVPKQFYKRFTQPQTDPSTELRAGVAALRLPVPEPKLPGARGTIKIPAWTFDRGNVDIYADVNRYANAGPLVGGPEDAGRRGKAHRQGSPRQSSGQAGQAGESVVEYDIHVPVAGDYILKARYASPEARPVEAFMNGRHLGQGFDHATFGTAPGELPVRLGGHSQAARRRHEEVFGGFEGPIVFTLSEGKQTLKLTRRGPLPNFMHLSLCNTTERFPKGWKPAERKMKHMERVPPMQRTAFLANDAVNIATLRLALEATIKTCGAKYPDGRQYLDRLARLEAEQVAAETAGTNEVARVESALQSLRSEAMFAHPELNFDKLLFLKTGKRYGHTYADQHSPGTNGNICVLSPVRPGGQVTELMPEQDGGRFDRFDLSFDAKKVVFGYSKDPDGRYLIYEIGIDPETGTMTPGSLRQITTPYDDPTATSENVNAKQYAQQGIDDMDPIYLPNGRFMFTSSRCQQTVFCAGGSVTALYTMDADGKNMRRITQGPINETSPSVMNDGRVIYTRWEYVDKGLGNGQALWAIRPDGSGSDHIFKNNTVWPAGMSAARSIPGSSTLIAIGGSHHHTARGSVILVDNRRTRIGVEPMTTITPEIGYQCMDSMGEFGQCYDPYPLSETFYLVSKDGVLYVMDRWGNRALLYRDPNPEIKCFEPFPLRPRHKPATLAATQEPAPTPAARKQPGTMFVQDVYQGMTGIERGRVKHLRVMGVLPWPWSENGTGWVGPDVHRKRVYGITKVHEDGSAYFEVPAEENVFFQALDENYRMLQHMPTFLNLRPGESRSCIGCHESRRKAPPQVAKRPQALDHPAQALIPLPGDTGPRAIHYMTDVQPILDKRCQSCHSGDKAEAGLVLTGEPTHDRNRSYENLMGRGLVSYMNDAYGRAHYRPEPPLTWGSNRSKLVVRLTKEPCSSGITEEELIRITTWNDANIPFYGTYRGKRDPKHRDEPDFRLPPVALK